MSDEKSNSDLSAEEWKSIAQGLYHRLNFAAAYGKFSGFRIDMKTGESQGTLDYLADGLELVPGVTVNREFLHMTPKEKRAYIAKKEKL